MARTKTRDRLLAQLRKIILRKNLRRRRLQTADGRLWPMRFSITSGQIRKWRIQSRQATLPLFTSGLTRVPAFFLRSQKRPANNPVHRLHSEIPAAFRAGYVLICDLSKSATGNDVDGLLGVAVRALNGRHRERQVSWTSHSVC